MADHDPLLTSRPRTYDAGTCSYGYATAEPASAAYVMEDGVCVAGDGVSAYAIGDALPRSSFVDVQFLGVGGRLQATGFAVDGRTFATNGAAWDSELEATCDPFLYDGALRCVPSRRHSVSAGSIGYADAACTEPLVPGYAQPGCDEMDYYGVEDDASLCAAAPYVALYRRDVPFAGDTVYLRDESEGCVAFELPDDLTVYRAVAVPADALVTLEVAID